MLGRVESYCWGNDIQLKNVSNRKTTIWSVICNSKLLLLFFQSTVRKHLLLCALNQLCNIASDTFEYFIKCSRLCSVVLQCRYPMKTTGHMVNSKIRAGNASCFGSGMQDRDIMFIITSAGVERILHYNDKRQTNVETGLQCTKNLFKHCCRGLENPRSHHSALECGLEWPSSHSKKCVKTNRLQNCPLCPLYSKWLTKINQTIALFFHFRGVHLLSLE